MLTSYQWDFDDCQKARNVFNKGKADQIPVCMTGQSENCWDGTTLADPMSCCPIKNGTAVCDCFCEQPPETGLTYDCFSAVMSWCSK